jgi:hypothetical protein
MAPVMTMQAQERSSGVLGLLTRGRERHGEVLPAQAVPTVSDLLAAAPVLRTPAQPVVVPAEDVEVVLAPEWLADLHDPSLIISHNYVGPDRRRTDRHPTGPRARPGYARTHGSGLRLVGIAIVALALVLSLAAVVVPSALAAVTGRLTLVRRLAPTTATRVHRVPRAGRSAAQTAWIAAAHLQARAAAAQRRGAHQAARAQARAAADQRRADHQAARAQARAAADQRRADRQATRAQAAAAQRLAAHQAAWAAVLAIRHAGVQRPGGGTPGTPAGS